MSPTEFSLTQHAIKRLVERFPNLKEKWDAEPVAAYRLKMVYDVLSHAREEKSIFNDTRFMAYLAEKYGGVKHAFFVLNDAVFVGVVDEKGNKIVTVIRKSFHASAHMRNA